MGVIATLRDIQSGYLSATAHTANNTLIEEALNKSLDRTGNVDNAMETELDLGLHRAINGSDAISDSDLVTFRQLRNAVQDSLIDGDAAIAIENSVDIAVANAIAEVSTGLVVQRVQYSTGFTNGQTVVPITEFTYIPGTNNISVYRNGLSQTPTIDFTEDSTTQITVTPGLVSDDILILRSNFSTTNSVTTTDGVSHTADSVTTSLADYLEAQLLVLLAQQETTGISHTNVDGTVDLDVFLEAQKSTLDSVEAVATNAWVSEEGTGDNAVYMTGAIVPFASPSTKVGWLKCDGAAVSRTTYARLFDDIGTYYGAGDGSTTFNVPDVRGEFVRGWDDGAGRDSGRVYGTKQSDTLQNITGRFKTFDRGVPGNTGAFSDIGAGAWSSSVASGNSDTWGAVTEFDASRVARTSTETRPRNIAFPYFIKT